jgi:hypothetical protein
MVLKVFIQLKILGYNNRSICQIVDLLANLFDMLVASDSCICGNYQDWTVPHQGHDQSVSRVWMERSRHLYRLYHLIDIDRHK